MVSECNVKYIDGRKIKNQSVIHECWHHWSLGIAAAKYQWILPLKSGDCLKQDIGAVLSRAIRTQPELNMLSAEALDCHGNVWCPEQIPHLLDKKNCPVGFQLFRKSLWQDVGGYQDWHPLGMVDLLFWLNCLDHGLLRRHLPSVYLTRADSSPSIMQNIPAELEQHACAMFATLIPRFFKLSALLAAHQVLQQTPEVLVEKIRYKLELNSHQSWLNFCMGLIQEGKGDIASALAYQRMAACLDEDAWQPHLRMYFLHKAMANMRAMKQDMQACMERYFELGALFNDE